MPLPPAKADIATAIFFPWNWTRSPADRAADAQRLGEPWQRGGGAGLSVGAGDLGIAGAHRTAGPRPGRTWGLNDVIKEYSYESMI